MSTTSIHVHREDTQMTATTKLTEQLLALPCDERIRIVEALLESLNAPPDEEMVQAWSRETEQRIDELDAGIKRSIPGEEVFAEIRHRLDK
jgi:putative addiction module component (TIGR02574 family)